MAGKHSILAPSGAYRWARCVGSLYYSRGVEEEEREYSASGTCSHFMGETKLTTPTFDLQSFLGKELEFGDVQKFKFRIDQDRIDRVATYANRVLAEPGLLLVEQKLNTSPVLGVPGQEGHSDAVKLDVLGAVEINGRPHVGVLTIHDFKDGWNVVHARDNLQGLIYLAAALYQYELYGDFRAFRFVIHQPRVNHYDEWTYTREELEAFCAIIRPAAKLAFDIYNGDVAFDPDTHLIAGEEQCHFCPKSGSCIKRAKRMVDMFAQPLAQSHDLDDTTLSTIYATLDELESMAKEFRAEAMRRALRGHTIAGHKLVRGKHPARKWKDPKRAEGALGLLLSPEQMYQPAEIISPTAAQTLLKKDYEHIEDMVDQGDGGLTLAPIDDKRKEVKVPKFGEVAPDAGSLI